MRKIHDHTPQNQHSGKQQSLKLSLLCSPQPIRWILSAFCPKKIASTEHVNCFMAVNWVSRERDQCILFGIPVAQDDGSPRPPALLLKLRQPLSSSKAAVPLFGSTPPNVHASRWFPRITYLYICFTMFISLNLCWFFYFQTIKSMSS